jgi:hypothetical protein
MDLGKLRLVRELECVAQATQWLVFSSERPAQVGSLVPSGFEMYVRIFHPAWREASEHDLSVAELQDSRRGPLVMTASDGIARRAVTWHEVADATGKATHPGMQWTSIRGTAAEGFRAESPSSWEWAPTRSSLTQQIVGELADNLADFTDTPRRCWCAVWEGYADMVGIREDTSLPRLLVGDKSMVVACGPVSAVSEASVNNGVSTMTDFNGFRSPSFWWPDDRAWCVSTGVDMDSTLLGMSYDCASRIMKDPRIEALPVRREQLITFASDTINS